MHSIVKQILQARKKQNLNREFVEIRKNTQNFSQIFANEKSVINFCSNDYLRLSMNEDVMQAMINGTLKYGVGSGGTRNISGTNTPHIELEHTIAKMHGKEKALLFSSAYAANVGALFSIGKYIPNVVFFSDEQNHASIIHGIKYSGAKKVIYKHNDLEHLEQLLQENQGIAVIVCESVYSMSGTVTNLRQMKAIAKKHGAIIYLDEVHSVGIYGNGRGLAMEQNVEIDIINGTLGKAFGTFGGYVVGSGDMMEFIKSFATTFIFSTSLPPAICMASKKAIEIATTQQNLQSKFWGNVKKTKEEFKKNDITIAETNSHIISVLIGNETKTKEIASKILEKGFYIQPIFYPTVELGKAIVRVTVSPFHTHWEIESLAKNLKEIMNSLT